MVRAAALLLVATAASGCVGLRPDCARPGLTAIEATRCRAEGGDKAAALELGRRYEAGRDVPRDLARAARLYRQAAQFTSGTTYVYSPPVGKNGRGTVIPVRTGTDQPGLAEAKYRLALLYLRGAGVKLDFEKASELLREAARQGFAPAREKLDELARLPRT